MILIGCHKFCSVFDWANTFLFKTTHNYKMWGVLLNIRIHKFSGPLIFRIKLCGASSPAETNLILNFKVFFRLRMKRKISKSSMNKVRCFIQHCIWSQRLVSLDLILPWLWCLFKDHVGLVWCISHLGYRYGLIVIEVWHNCVVWYIICWKEITFNCIYFTFISFITDFWGCQEGVSFPCTPGSWR